MGSCTQSENVSRKENIAKNLSLYWHLHEGTYLYIWYLLQYVYPFHKRQTKRLGCVLVTRPKTWLWILDPTGSQIIYVHRSWRRMPAETTWKFAVFDFLLCPFLLLLTFSMFSKNNHGEKKMRDTNPPCHQKMPICVGIYCNVFCQKLLPICYLNKDFWKRITLFVSRSVILDLYFYINGDSVDKGH